MISAWQQNQELGPDGGVHKYGKPQCHQSYPVNVYMYVHKSVYMTHGIITGVFSRPKLYTARIQEYADRADTWTWI